MITTIHNSKISISVNSFGGELCKMTDENGKDILWTGDEPYWTSHSTVIFPICGRLNEGKYTYRGKTYELGCHGLARHQEFAVKAEDNKIICTLVANEETKKVYPFDFVLTIVYEIYGSKLIVTETVKNTDEKELIFTLGAHPGFCLPLEEGLAFEDYQLRFPRKEAQTIVLSDKLLATNERKPIQFEKGNSLPLRHSLFSLDAVFFDNKLKSVILEAKEGKYRISVDCSRAKRWGIWHTPRTEAPFVCIEPWLGMPSVDGPIEDLESKPEMEHLASGKLFDFVYTLEYAPK